MKYFNYHRHAAYVSFRRLIYAPLTTFMSLLAISIALSLPTGLFVLTDNFRHLTSHWNNNAPISVYLKTTTSQLQTNQLIKQLHNDRLIKEIKYISPQQGLAEFAKQTDFADIFQSLNENPLPGVIEIQPFSMRSPFLQELLNHLKNKSEIDNVQVDLEWVNRFSTLLDITQRTLIVLGLLLSLGVLFIISNTIHLLTLNHHKEIEVYKLVGATRGFIRRPYLYSGILLGLISGLIAWLSIEAVIHWIATPIQNLAKTYQSNLQVHGLNFKEIFFLLFFSSLLGFIGSWIAIGRQLKRDF